MTNPYSSPQSGTVASGAPTRQPGDDGLAMYLPESESGAGATLSFRRVDKVLPDKSSLTVGGFVRDQVCYLDRAVRDQMAAARQRLQGRDDSVNAALATAYGLDLRPGDRSVSRRLVDDEVSDDTRERPAVGHRWAFEPGLGGVPRTTEEAGVSPDEYTQGSVPLSALLFRAGLPPRWLHDIDLKPLLDLAREGLALGRLLVVPSEPSFFVPTRVPVQDQHVELSLFVAGDTDLVSFVRLARNTAVRYLRARASVGEEASVPDTLATDAVKLAIGGQGDELGVDARGHTIGALVDERNLGAELSLAPRQADSRTTDLLARALASSTDGKQFRLSLSPVRGTIRCLPANLEVA